MSTNSANPSVVSNPFKGNPFKIIRLQHNYSQYDISRMAKISKHAVLRLEQGMYESPLPTLVNFYVHQFKVSRAQLLSDYEDFQFETRKETGRFLGAISNLLSAVGPEHHPLTYLRELKGLNPTEVAKRLCISQSAVVYFERRSIHQHTVPAQLLNALSDAGYTPAELKAFEEAYTDYRNNLISDQRFTLVNSVPEQDIA